ncbi:MAG: hypothetical protein M5U01_14050 [Ardenticatenaceae bacterium]|nr:hypothetical protein [Ardenticatenaceae bacterium]
MDRRREQLKNPLETQFLVICPACGQKYLLAGVQVQSQEEMACNVCNSTFRLIIQDSKVTTELVTGPTGSPLGPAEGRVRH